MELKIVICEDEITHRNILKEYLCKILDEEFLEYSIIEYSSGEELLAKYPNKVDILFLDIQMYELSGMHTARKIREFDKDVEIIFTTAIEKYVFEAYEVKAYRYLIKPLNYSEIRRQIKLCISDYLDKNRVISIESRTDTIVLPINEILYAEVRMKEVTIYTESGTYTIKVSMKRVENKLLNYNFFRCHHSYLVNLKKINELKNSYVIINSNEVPVSRGKYKELKKRLVNLLGDSLC